MVGTSNMLNVAIRLWMALSWLCLGAVNATSENRVFNLPAMSINVTVKYHDQDRSQFQSRMSSVLQGHLNRFFDRKLNDTGYGDTVTVNNIGLSSFYQWNAVADDSLDILKHYDVIGHYDCQIRLKVNITEGTVSHLTQSQIELFFIEAFQQGNYWTLVHKFLADEVLSGVNNVKIVVHSDGFVPVGERDPTARDYNDGREWTAAIKTGVVVAGFFCLGMVGIWLYMYHYVRQTPDEKGNQQSDETTTELGSSDHNVDSKEIRRLDDDSSTNSSWMDSWAQRMTSIPLREPVKKKSKKARRHQPMESIPSHNLMLDCIREGADEDASVLSFRSRSSVASHSSMASRTSKASRKESRAKKQATSHSQDSYSDSTRVSLNPPVAWLTHIEEETTEPVTTTKTPPAVAFRSVPVPAVPVSVVPFEKRRARSYGRLPVKDPYNKSNQRRDSRSLASI
eukprot:scaffold1567_cov102-Cylindrotheca_fusiformis.AAC.2